MCLKSSYISAAHISVNYNILYVMHTCQKVQLKSLDLEQVHKEKLGKLRQQVIFDILTGTW